MQRSVHIDIGVNGAFLTRRWEDPDNWMRLTAELGFPYHEFCADVLDPFFSGDFAYQQETAQAVSEAARQYGVTVWDIYTGVATHRFHGLAHSDASVRERMREWIRASMRLARGMGARRVGGHWDAIPVELLDDPQAVASREAQTVEQFRQLALEAEPLGLAAIYNEQMYIPSERPWTIAGAIDFLRAANADRAGVPILLTVDTGHQAGLHYGLQGEDLDYRAWLRALAPFCEVIHLQQTTPDASHHWPFTPKHNELGHVRLQEVLSSVEDGFRRADRSPLRPYLTPVEEQIWVAEIIPGSTKTEAQLLDELDVSRKHLRQFVPEGGIDIAY